ncbi:hypothetical protein K9N68_37260 (plasmid) [Kovacikia minuta CCNUW1]|uniref:hypothetical protein n=1 Tax=Kovacikia minuta TaxID=2931930 RepID=UPI001CCC759B|nr:hypothetical protein [Kovacikia minuta]UBF29862.1 hypothetical protein K9N68_37260 [Kovacikia minuta CCNUW1]
MPKVTAEFLEKEELLIQEILKLRPDTDNTEILRILNNKRKEEGFDELKTIKWLRQRLYNKGIHIFVKAKGSQVYGPEEVEKIKSLAAQLPRRRKGCYSLREITEKLLPHFPGRTFDGLQNKIKDIVDMPRVLSRGPVSRREKEYLEEILGELPFLKAFKKHNEWRKENNLSRLTEEGFRRKLKLFGLHSKIASSTYFSLLEVASGLGCSDTKIRRWLKDDKYRNILKPFRNGHTDVSPIYFHRARLKAFFVAFPLEIQEHQPDMLWFVDILTDGVYTLTVGEGYEGDKNFVQEIEQRGFTFLGKEELSERRDLLQSETA